MECVIYKCASCGDVFATTSLVLEHVLRRCHMSHVRPPTTSKLPAAATSQDDGKLANTVTGTVYANPKDSDFILWSGPVRWLNHAPGRYWVQPIVGPKENWFILPRQDQTFVLEVGRTWLLSGNLW
jgi:hypothetical protein